MEVIMNINIKILFLVLTLLLTMSLVSASNETSVVDYDKSIDDNVIVDENFNNGSNNYINNTKSLEKDFEIDAIPIPLNKHDIYESNSISSSKINTYFTFNTLNVCKGDSFSAILKAVGSTTSGTTLSGKSVQMTINGVTYTRTTNSNGIVSKDINLNPGNYEVIYRFNGDSSYNSFVENINITVHADTNTYIIPAINNNLYRTEYFNVALFDYNENRLSGKIVKIIANGYTYTRTTDSNGIAKLQINLNPGTYSISYSFAGNGSYQSCSGSKSITVSLMNTALIPIDTYVKNYGGVVRIRMTDNNAVPISNQKISIQINGVTYYRTTNGTGFAAMTIDSLSTGTYSNCKISYTAPTGSMYNSNSGVTFTLKVFSSNNNQYILTSQGNFVANGNYYKVKLTNTNNVPLTSKTITLIINGVQYSRTTDSSGIAKISLDLPEKNLGVSASFGDSSSSCGLYEILTVTSGAMNTNFVLGNYTISQYKTDACSYQCLSNSYITNLAQTLTSTCINDLEKAIAIHSYVYRFNYLNYGNGLKDSFNTGLFYSGNCHDQANTALSLLKSVGVPVRGCVGFNTTMGHAWIQVLLNNNWIVSDPTGTQYFGEWNLNGYNGEYFTTNRNYCIGFNKDVYYYKLGA